MKILVLSDTHFRKGYSLNDKFIKELLNSEMIIHCGDFVSLEFYNFLNSSSKLIAVKGNNDYSLSNDLPWERKVEIEGFKIAITHGHLVSPNNIHYKFPDSDIILYGHEHHPAVERYKEQFILSPGSLTSNRYVNYNSFLTLELKNGSEPVIEIHQID